MKSGFPYIQVFIELNDNDEYGKFDIVAAAVFK